MDDLEVRLDALARVLAERLDMILSRLDVHDPSWVSPHTIRKVRPQPQPRVWNDGR